MTSVLIGLAVMGQNLVLNMNDHGYKVAVFNRTVSKVDDFINERGQGYPGRRERTRSRNWPRLLKRPRRVMLMVKAGETVDEMIEQLLPHLEAGRHHHRRRQLAFHGHQSPHQVSGGEGHPLHRHGRFGRRRRRAPRPLHHARRQSRCMAACERDLPGDRRQSGRRNALLRLGGRRRRRPLRQDGAQRH